MDDTWEILDYNNSREVEIDKTNYQLMTDNPIYDKITKENHDNNELFSKNHKDGLFSKNHKDGLFSKNHKDGLFSKNPNDSSRNKPKYCCTRFFKKFWLII